MNLIRCFSVAGLLCFPLVMLGAEYSAPRCEVIPLTNHEVSLRIDGMEKTRWHYGTNAPRPFFFPFNGPSGASLTRMGHPGAENHDHHRSVWFAHNSVNDVIYWSDRTKARIRQKHWYAYLDGDEEAIMAACAGWYNEEGVEVMEQETVAALRPRSFGEHALEIQVTFRPAKNAKSVKLGKTNFGFLAVRVAKSVSAYFGGGVISNSEGQVDEINIFGKPARWMDYSGPVAVGEGRSRKSVTEGITFFDHPSNPRYPTSWHVREDGWMGASFCMHEGLEVTHEKPLTLRYLLHAHRGGHNRAKAEGVAEEFGRRRGFEVYKSKRKHRQYEVKRK
ncbi:MAG: hypothetical protein CMO80_21090 [Verrucomicrobiales bacterium]|nr:hypothetical protein [Verrucomicrobiales bacterium]